MSGIAYVISDYLINRWLGVLYIGGASAVHVEMHAIINEYITDITACVSPIQSLLLPLIHIILTARLVDKQHVTLLVQLHTMEQEYEVHLHRNIAWGLRVLH